MATFNSTTGPAGPGGPTGQAGGMGALIATVTASSSATLDFTNNVGAYTAWRLVGNVLLPATDTAVLWFRFGTGGGPTYATTNYSYGLHNVDSANTAGTAGATAQAQAIFSTGGISNAGAGISFDITIVRDAAAIAGYFGTGMARGSTTWGFFRCGGHWPLAAAITSMRLLMSTGNIASGTASLYGISQ